MMLDGLQPEILLPAFVAGLLVLVTHVPLGREVLRRGIIFMDLAIAQFAGLGLIAIHATGLDVPPGLAQLAAAAAALLGAVLLEQRGEPVAAGSGQWHGAAALARAARHTSCLACVLSAVCRHGNHLGSGGGRLSGVCQSDYSRAGGRANDASGVSRGCAGVCFRSAGFCTV